MATPEGTVNYFQRLKSKSIPDHAIRLLGKTHFKVSSVGFGGYRIHHNSIEHAKALRYALLNGCNLIDTSSNYTDGGSEMLIGNILLEMFEREEISRDELVVVSKVGYVQGQNLNIARQYEADGQPFPEMVKYMESCWHCIHPEFLEDQLRRSLDRLKLAFLDVYLLHNPEYFLSDKKKNNGIAVSEARNIYYSRLKTAFEWLEEKVAEGKIKAYGISSNTFPTDAGDFEHTSLQRVIQIAESVSSDNYFHVIQFPFNLFEIGACTEPNQDNGATLLDLAKKHNLATLTNRPLNASYNGKMIRLASFRETDSKLVIDSFYNKLTTIQRLEKQFKDEWRNKLPESMNPDNIQKIFSLAVKLQDAFTTFENWEEWDYIKQYMLVPQSFSYIKYLTDHFEDNGDWAKWAEFYSNAIIDLFDVIARHYENETQERSIKISGKLKNLDQDLATSDTLSQQTLRVLTSVENVNCVLLGMRRTPYVEDALAAMKAPRLANAKNLLIQFNQ